MRAMRNRDKERAYAEQSREFFFNLSQIQRLFSCTQWGKCGVGIFFLFMFLMGFELFRHRNCGGSRYGRWSGDGCGLIS